MIPQNFSLRWFDLLFIVDSSYDVRWLKTHHIRDQKSKLGKVLIVYRWSETHEVDLAEIARIEAKHCIHFNQCRWLTCPVQPRSFSEFKQLISEQFPRDFIHFEMPPTFRKSSVEDPYILILLAAVQISAPLNVNKIGVKT